MVIKAHSVGNDDARQALTQLVNLGMANRTLVLMTSRGEDATPADFDTLRSFGLTVAHVTPTTHVAAASFRADRVDYQRIFELTDRQMEELEEWLEAWSELRLCCGVEMSDAWRTQLVPGAKTNKRSFTGDDNNTAVLQAGIDRVVRMCSTLNLTQAEANLMQTRLYKRMGGRMKTLGKVSNVDMPLTGDYCETCTANVSRAELWGVCACVT